MRSIIENQQLLSLFLVYAGSSPDLLLLAECVRWKKELLELGAKKKKEEKELLN